MQGGAGARERGKARARGERVVRGLGLLASFGSSPRARGTGFPANRLRSFSYPLLTGGPGWSTGMVRGNADHETWSRAMGQARRAMA
jgi:hypothetical protein